MKPIGPTFPVELESAGLMGLPFSWGDDGVIQFDDRMTDKQKEAVMQVYENHDPSKSLE